MRGHHDLRIAAWGSIACAVLALLVPLEALSLLFLAPLAFFLTGYSITAATFARRTLERPQTVLLSLGLSLCVLALGALVLDLAPGGIRDVSWAILLVVVVLASSRSAALRRPRGFQSQGVAPRRPGTAQAALLTGGFVLAVAAIFLGNTTVSVKDAIGYTQLWLLPETNPQVARFQVGVGSQEQESVDYDLRIRIDRGRVIRRSFTLVPGETEVVRVSDDSLLPGSAVPVVATLLRHNRPFDVYRRVTGWLRAPEAAG
jgi:hypothetical protein